MSLSWALTRARPKCRLTLPSRCVLHAAARGDKRRIPTFRFDAHVPGGQRASPRGWRLMGRSFRLCGVAGRQPANRGATEVHGARNGAQRNRRYPWPMIRRRHPTTRSTSVLSVRPLGWPLLDRSRLDGLLRVSMIWRATSGSGAAIGTKTTGLGQVRYQIPLVPLAPKPRPCGCCAAVRADAAQLPDERVEEPLSRSGLRILSRQ